jgi:predicted nucleic acid-binding protein
VIVADASVTVTALVDGGDAGKRARAALSGDGLCAPALLDVEVLQALRGRVRGGRLGAEPATRAVADLARLPIRRLDSVPLLERIWRLRDNVTAYDAAYVALAEALDAVLVTADARLAAAPGPRCRFEVLTG